MLPEVQEFALKCIKQSQTREFCSCVTETIWLSVSSHIILSPSPSHMHELPACFNTFSTAANT